MFLPSKKDYPDYHKVITDPIDMSMIENKIKGDKVCLLPKADVFGKTSGQEREPKLLRLTGPLNNSKVSL